MTISVARLARPRDLSLLERAWWVLTSTAFLGLALFVLTWPVPSLVPQPGLDFSFAAGLHMAAVEHLKYGTEIVGTYGPLGFLRYPLLYYTWTARLALLYTGGVHLLLCLTLVWALRRMLPAAIAVLVAWLAVALIATQPESALVVTIVWLIEYLRAGSSPRLKRAFPLVAGAVGGFEVLVKINTGVTIAVLGGLATLIATRGRRRPLAVFAASFLVTFFAAWFAAGQSLGNIGPYISTARQVISGWSTAMQYPGPEYQLWAALAAAVAVLVIAWQSTRMERAAARWGIIAIWLALGFSAFKEGFVGQTPGHEIIYFVTALGAAIAFSWRGAARTPVLWCISLLIALGFSITQYAPGTLIDPSGDASALADQLETATNAGKRYRLMTDARQQMDAAYGVDAATLGALRGHTVNVMPSEQSILWANQLYWRPVPVYQLYYALTPALDRLNASVLASPRGPERLLRTLSDPVNSRNNLFDSPAAQRAMLCHFKAVLTTATDEVLARVPDRCGAPKLVQTIRAHWEQFVTVPAPQNPDDLVYVTVDGVAPHGLESLRALFWRSYTRGVGLKQGAGPVRNYAIVPDTVADGLTLSVPPSADFPGTFSLNAAADELAFGISSGSKARALTYRFYEEPVTPAA